MKLSITELKEIKQQIDKGLTLCLPQSISLKQYHSIIKQIDNYTGYETLYNLDNNETLKRLSNIIYKGRLYND